MANSVEAGWHGHDYQARFFWIHASALRDPDQTHVCEVSYEANGPKAFDDVIVRYDPPRPSTGPNRIAVDFHQIKFHVTVGGRFGYLDLIDPAFIGATTFSVLERLKKAKESAPKNSAFTLVTVDGIRDSDPLGSIISATDYALRMDKIFVAGGDRSKMGKVRKLWREHLRLKSDEELREVLSGFHITAAHRSLQQLRDEVNLRFKVVGLVSCNDTIEFRFDAAARALKASGRNKFSRADFESLCNEEGWIRSQKPEEYLNVAIRSFGDGPTDRLDARPEQTLSLLDLFGERHLLSYSNWISVVQPAVVNFLTKIRQRHKRIRLFLDAHSSIAFLAGVSLGLKSGVAVEFVQKGRSGVSVWRPDDGCRGDNAVDTVEDIGEGTEIALVVSLSRNALDDVRNYLKKSVPSVGKLVHISAVGGPSQRSVIGGEHAAQLADAAATTVKVAKSARDTIVHIFVAGPNSFTFYLGQNREALGPCILYEFDFGGSAEISYRPSFSFE
ncbi:MAG: SAVED domain-containing protein [Undibacterium umbellatum]|uniref:SAVED domain-containing protein n=1 Tax=Undibacterium umbellatum TaxID=2762300 RepID=UPI003BB71BF8